MDCETQAFDVEECKESGIRKKSGLCEPMLAVSSFCGIIIVIQSALRGENGADNDRPPPAGSARGTWQARRRLSGTLKPSSGLNKAGEYGNTDVI